MNLHKFSIPNPPFASLSRRLRLELLEDRRLLAVTVDTLDDVVDANDNLTSLREAIAAASAGETIDFDGNLGGTLELSLGELLIDKPLSIVGPGTGVLTLDASMSDLTPTIEAGDGARLFRIDDGTTANIEVTISGLTLTGGDAAGDGGAIRSVESLTLDDVVLTENFASSDGGAVFAAGTGSTSILRSTLRNNRAGSDGGSVFASTIDGGRLVINHSLITGSTAGSDGGGVYAKTDGGATAISYNSIDNNRATSGNGGGVWARTINGQTTVAHTTLHTNEADADGGGLWSHTTDGTTTVVSSTISTNAAGVQGGGAAVENDLGAATRFAHSTIASNTARGLGLAFGTDVGIGIFAAGDGQTALDHTLVAGHFSNDGGSVTPDIVGSITAFSSLLEDNTGQTAFFTGDPKLGPLADHGGVGKMHALLAGSFAIDAFFANAQTPPLSDQRGNPFARVADGNNDSISGLDIGAYELQSDATLPVLVVDTLVDESDGDYSNGDFSLREAIGLANGNVDSASTITFAPALNGGTIGLELGEMRITDALTIDASNLAIGITIDAGNGADGIFNTGDGTRIFDIDDSDDSNEVDVAINKLTLTGGDQPFLDGGDFRGGAIRSGENLSILNSVITANGAIKSGGGIEDFGGGNLMIIDSTISANFISRTVGSGTDGGAGIFKSGGTLTIQSSTISSNITTGGSSDGGGIAVMNATTTISDSTISGNAASEIGGGIHASGGSMEISSSTVRGNSANRGGGISTAGVTNITSSTISDNMANARGGGILAHGATTIIESTISGNTTNSFGGGIRIYGIATIIDSTISENTAFSGGGISSDSSSNVATIQNSTISGNSAGSSGGGVHSRTGTMSIEYSTITNNTAPLSEGSGVASSGDIGTDTLITHSIISGNNDGVGEDIAIVGSGTTNTFTSLGYNLIGTGNTFDSGTQMALEPFNLDTTNLIGLGFDPLLEPLADNGGPTLTHNLGTGSDAIDAGNAFPAFFFDQRGDPFVRLFDGNGDFIDEIDLGAVEFQPPPVIADSADFDDDNDVDGADFLLWQRGYGTTPNALKSDGDADCDGTVNHTDLGYWSTQFGQPVPPVAASRGGEASPATVTEHTLVAVVSAAPALDPLSGFANRPAVEPLSSKASPLHVATIRPMVREQAFARLAEPLSPASRQVADEEVFVQRRPANEEQADAEKRLFEELFAEVGAEFLLEN